MVRTIDSERGIRYFLLRVNEERVVHYILGDVTLHVLRLLTIVL